MTRKMYNWTIQDKMIIAFKAFIFGPIIHFIETYVFNDWDFLVTVLLLMFIDAIIMTVRALMQRTYKIETAFNDFFKKTLAITFTITCISIIDLALIDGERSVFIDWVNGGFYSVLLMFINVSILKNIYHIYPLPIIADILDKVDKWKGKNKNNGIDVEK
jgi:phage-related holin